MPSVSLTPSTPCGDRLLLIDKPAGWTSFDVVKRVRSILGVKKVGHAGTLDPLATGLLLLCSGKATKRLTDYQGLPKCYEGAIVVGRTTPSFDLETPFDSETPYSHLLPEALHEAARKLTGPQLQTPPAYSAIKVAGKRAYQAARQGELLTLAPRSVTIYSFAITTIQLPLVHFEISCSKGTYIRALARDFGQLLGVGAYLGSLRRTAIGPFHVAEAYSLSRLAAETLSAPKLPGVA